MKAESGKISEYIEMLNRCKSVTGFPGMIIAIAKRKMSEEIVEYKEAQKKIFEKYGKKQEDKWIIPKDSPDFEKALSEIMQVSTYQVDVSIPQFSEEEFLQKFTSEELAAEDYETLYEIFVKKEEKDGEQN